MVSKWGPKSPRADPRTRRPEVCIKVASLKRWHRRDSSDNDDTIVLES